MDEAAEPVTCCDGTGKSITLTKVVADVSILSTVASPCSTLGVAFDESVAQQQPNRIHVRARHFGQRSYRSNGSYDPPSTYEFNITGMAFRLAGRGNRINFTLGLQIGESTSEDIVEVMYHATAPSDRPIAECGDSGSPVVGLDSKIPLMGFMNDRSRNNPSEGYITPAFIALAQLRALLSDEGAQWSRVAPPAVLARLSAAIGHHLASLKRRVIGTLAG